jgi:hypothetical protein
VTRTIVKRVRRHSHFDAALVRFSARQCTGSNDGASGFASSFFGCAASRRFLSLSFMNSSYLTVPGRGGASAGRPPAQCGIASLIPAASFSLMVPQALTPHAGRTTATRRVNWRMVTGICGASHRYDLVTLTYTSGGRLVRRAKVLIYLMHGPSKDLICRQSHRPRIRNRPGTAAGPIVEIDIVAHLGRHAAPIHG